VYSLYLDMKLAFFYNRYFKTFSPPFGSTRNLKK